MSSTQHVFSDATGVCVSCGTSAADHAILGIKCEPHDGPRIMIGIANGRVLYLESSMALQAIVLDYGDDPEGRPTPRKVEVCQPQGFAENWGEFSTTAE